MSAAQIAEALPDSSHEYREWILTYASEDYLELPAKHEHLIDTLGPAQPYGAFCIRRRLYLCRRSGRRVTKLCCSFSGPFWRGFRCHMGIFI